MCLYFVLGGEGDLDFIDYKIERRDGIEEF